MFGKHAHELPATDFALDPPYGEHDGVCYDPDSDAYYLGRVVQAETGPFVAPDPQRDSDYPPAPADWRERVQGQWRS
jgi:hypothetical protein